MGKTDQWRERYFCTFAQTFLETASEGEFKRKKHQVLSTAKTEKASKHIKEMYQLGISASILSVIADKILPAMNEWRTCSLESVYAFVYKIREGGRVIIHAVFYENLMKLEEKRDKKYSLPITSQ